jgi:[ribosomal protein S18]-alanine N-acetyltransferase
MQLTVKKMNEDFAKEILQWTYEKPYDFYNNELSPEGMHEFLSNSYYAVVDLEENLVGFFCLGKAAQVPSGDYREELLDIGLGMKPELTGNGLGCKFFSFILSQIKEKHLRLSVAAFNKRAIHLYEKLGFLKESEFKHKGINFIIMVRNNEYHC